MPVTEPETKAFPRTRLAAENISAFYGRKQVLGGITIRVEAGKCLCLSGPNGCGKSTLMSILCRSGTRRLTHTGSVTLDGVPLQGMSRKELARQVAFMPQTEFSAWNYTAHDVVLSGRFSRTGFAGSYGAEDRRIAQDSAEELGIAHLLERPVHSLSGGEFQRVRIARAFAQQPRFLVLDEPAAALDLGVRFSLLALIKGMARSKGIGVLFSVHDVNLAAVFADTLALLLPVSAGGQSRLVTGNAEEVLTPENLSEAYGRGFGVFRHPAYGCPVAYVSD